MSASVECCVPSLLVVRCALAACDKKNDEPPRRAAARACRRSSRAGGRRGQPAGDHPVHAPTGARRAHAGMPAGRASAARRRSPAAARRPPTGAVAGTTPGDVPFDPKTVIAGVIKLDDKVKDKVAAGDTIFLVARGTTRARRPGPAAGGARS